MDNNTCTIVLIGDGYVGKTSIVDALSHIEFSDSSNPNIINETTINRDSLNFNVIDTAGQEEYSHIRKRAYEQANLFLLCFCLTDKTSFDNIRNKWVKDLELYKNVPKILIGTKSDLPNHEIKFSDGEKLKKKLNCLYYIECSSKNKVGIDEILVKATEIFNDKDQKRNCVIQ
ncbi:ras-like GTP-binding protein RhoL [Aethina tumida]|uniref:ras-like GTP-binding protein RhoL n=1 Tax=Aethina tumida TaxID=116153 RepID=UPI00096B58EC|nr:ras-like GTP-binding protein RhoL [Aethina tumida]